MTTDILCEVQNGLCTLTLNRPAKLNALKASIFREIDTHLDRQLRDEIDFRIQWKRVGEETLAGHDAEDETTEFVSHGEEM